MLFHPLVLVGGAAVAIYLLFRGQEQPAPAPEPAHPKYVPPPPAPTYDFDPTIGTAKEPFKYAANAQQTGIKDGTARGTLDARANLSPNPNPMVPALFASSPQLRGEYNTGYFMGYSQGYGTARAAMGSGSGSTSSGSSSTSTSSSDDAAAKAAAAAWDLGGSVLGVRPPYRGLR